MLKHAIPSQQERRVLITFGKSQPKKPFHSEFPRFLSPSPPPITSSPWGPTTLVSPNVARRPPPGLKQYVVVSNAGVLPPPSVIQPMLITPTPAPIPMPVAVPPVSAGWTPVTAPRGPPRLPVPGTGVFLPPSGSGPFPPQHHECNGVEKPNVHQAASPKAKTEGAGADAGCNGVGKGDEEIGAQKAATNPAAAAEAK